MTRHVSKPHSAELTERELQAAVEEAVNHGHAF
jgi:hypothetical protein